jgi:dTDP-4-amino-4,6-dideoxygalactose transaminase
VGNRYRIPVARPYLPSRAKLDKYIDGIYERAWLTNNGLLVQELTRRLQDYLRVEHLLLVGNGTLALQIAYRALGVVGSGPREAITTPFTFVATASSLKWEGLRPVFIDIDSRSWCLDPIGIEPAITPNTRAVVPVHVFGNACDTEAIDEVSRRHDLKVIYDGAHAFGVELGGRSLLSFGDATTLSFHATKLFHTIEGGAVVFRREDDLQRAKRLINFGITGPERIEALGINAKMNEFQAAMGLCVLDEIEENLAARKRVWCAYEQGLRGNFQLQIRNPEASNNYAYMPVVFADQALTSRVQAALEEVGVHTRRYFYPSLDAVPSLGPHAAMHRSRDIAQRILCLPIYAGLENADLEMILDILTKVTA